MNTAVTHDPPGPAATFIWSASSPADPQRPVSTGIRLTQAGQVLAVYSSVADAAAG